MPRTNGRYAMEWWGFVLVAIVVIALIVAIALAVQARRRRGGVISGRGGKPGPKKPGAPS
ncbi:MAG: hypothetical protein ACQERF_08435 [Actinomycetota bacterium]